MIVKSLLRVHVSFPIYAVVMLQKRYGFSVFTDEIYLPSECKTLVKAG